MYKYHLKQEKALAACANLAEILDPFWANKQDEIMTLAEHYCKENDMTFMQALCLIEMEVQRGVNFHESNEKAVAELQIMWGGMSGGIGLYA